MTIQTAINLIKKYEPVHSDFIRKAMIAERYYQGDTDIKYKEAKNEEGVRTADNRVSRDFYGLLVDQKSAYLFTEAPIFDTGNKWLNKKVTETLGEEFTRECQKLCVNASNTSVGWAHYWRGEHGIEYAVVDSSEIVPIWSKGLKKQLLAVLRIYSDIDENTGDQLVVYEIWIDTECASYCRKVGDSVELLREFPQFPVSTTYSIYDIQTEYTNILTHDLGEVPFIAFYNNSRHRSDLDRVKKLIDVYDVVFSGFVDDLEDIQELILILTGYGGTNMSEFLDDLKRYKVIKMDADEGSGLDTLKMEIPVEARQTLLDLTRQAIIEVGQGYDPRPENFGNSSGVALRFFYAPLEMKAGQMETEFRLGFARLVKAICRGLGTEVPVVRQTWTRTAIRSDLETVQMCAQSVGVVSQKTILEHHPFVEDVDAEEQRLKEEEEAGLEYQAAFPLSPARDAEGGEQTAGEEE